MELLAAQGAMDSEEDDAAAVAAALVSVAALMLRSVCLLALASCCMGAESRGEEEREATGPQHTGTGAVSGCHKSKAPMNLPQTLTAAARLHCAALPTVRQGNSEAVWIIPSGGRGPERLGGVSGGTAA